VRKAGRWTYIGLLLVFLLALGLRCVKPLSRQVEWYSRPIGFFAAVLEGHWADTLFSEHPGVTTMWVVGGTEYLVYAVRTALGQHPAHPSDVEGRAFIYEMSVGVYALAVCVALAIILAWYPLRRLFGERVAWVAVILMALDPYFVATSSALHLDALLTVFMMLSALMLLVYLRDDTWRFLVASAICGGLAFLTKAPSLFLLPFSALALFVAFVGRKQFNLGTFALRWLLPLLLWIGIAAAVYVLLYPAMWAVPDKALGRTISQTAHDAQTPHFNPVYFLGESHIDDPGPWFYVYTVAFKSSGVSLGLAVLGVVAVWRLPGQQRRSALLVIVYIVCFGLQMTIGAKKGPRYILPVFPLFSVIAALGWTAWQRGVFRWLRRKSVAWVISTLPIAALAAILLTVHPYYGTHYNLLFGGIRAAARVFALQEQGEGVDLAAQWLEAQGGKRLRVAVQLPAVFIPYTAAQAIEFDDLDVGYDYLVFDRNHIVRDYRVVDWEDEWKQYHSREPVFYKGFGGVPHVWGYRALPAMMDETTPDHVFSGWLGADIELIGYDWQEGLVSASETLPLHLYWRTARALDADYTVFVHVHGPDGQLLAQCDSPPLGGARPTTTWQADEIIRDACEVTLPPDAQAGEYRVYVGMYTWPELERLPARAAEGAEWPDGRLPLLAFELGDANALHLPWLWMGLAWLATLTVFGVGVTGMWRREEEPGV
jgi:4-amino-4-deoxy-L-arabinose transferase-like glycosyltransferase